MRFRGTTRPQTAAERQAKCRAIKKGTYYYCPTVPPEPAGLPNPAPPNLLPNASSATPPQQALPAPAAPAPARQKSLSSDGRSRALPAPPALPADGREGREGRGELCLPAGVAARLRSLLDKHEAGKTLTAAERSEAEGLLDIADYFAVQRLRQRFAA